MDSAGSTAISSNFAKSTNDLSKLAAFLATFRRYQAWSLPSSIVYYMAKNPSSSKCYQKLIQTCKYFFIKKPILIPQSSLNFNYKENEWRFIYAKRKFIVDVRNVKFWMTDKQVFFNQFKLSDLAIITPKIYQSDIKQLNLWNQNIYFNDLKFLLSKGEKFYSHDSIVLDEKNSAVVVEKIVAALPTVKRFCYFFLSNTPNIISSKTVKKLFKIPHFSNLNSFGFSKIPEDFDINAIFSYLKKNKKTKFNLYFDQISQQHKNHLQEIVNEIISTENRIYKPPYIEFPGIDPKVSEILLNLQTES